MTKPARSLREEWKDVRGCVCLLVKPQIKNGFKKPSRFLRRRNPSLLPGWTACAGVLWKPKMAATNMLRHLGFRQQLLTRSFAYLTALPKCWAALFTFTGA